MKLSRTFFIFAFVFILTYSTISPVYSVNAVDIIKIKSDILIGWSGGDVERPVVPRNELKQLNVSVEFILNHGKGISEGSYDFLLENNKNAYVRIDLEVIDAPSWCSANFKYPHLALNFSNHSKSEIGLNLLVNENAPAYSIGILTIKASFNKINTAPMIDKVTKEFDLTFVAAYFPSINVTIANKSNIKEISPYDTAKFQLNISNLGNEETIVFAEVTSLPSGWSATISDQIYINGEESEQMNISIRPSNAFGFHDRQGIVKVSLTPARAFNASDKGDAVHFSFLIKSKGIATSGFETELFIFSFILIGILLYINKIKRKSSN